MVLTDLPGRAAPSFRRLEAIERDAWLDLYASAPPAWAAGAGLRHEAFGSTHVLLLKAAPIGQFNRLVGLGVDEPASEATLDSALACFAGAGIGGFFVHLCPGAGPPALPDWLARRRLVPYRRAWAKFWRGTAPPPAIATDLRITAVGPERAADFALAVCDGFGMPPAMRPWTEAMVGRPDWQAYVAYDGATPAGAAALYCRDGAGWLGVAATLPAYRRRGVQGALMARRIADAIAAGCRDIVSETGEPVPGEPNASYHNMLRNGFTAVYSRPNYVMAQ